MLGMLMPCPAPLGGGGGGELEGEITVGNYLDELFGWSDGSIFPVFGSLSGDASLYFTAYFAWIPAGGEGLAYVNGDLTGSVLSFQGETYIGLYNSEYDQTWFFFGPEIATWPTSGTHHFTLTLP